MADQWEDMDLGFVGEGVDNQYFVTKEWWDGAIAAAKLDTHAWLPAVQTKADLPEPPKPDELNYLCRIIADSEAANNGVWQWIAGSGEWTYYSDNADWVDETELAAAIEALPDGSTTELDGSGKLAVKDGGIATAKIAAGAVTAAKLAGTLDLSGSGYTLSVKTAAVPSS